MGDIAVIDNNRKKYWGSAALSFWFSRLNRGSRDRRCWIFGAWHGERFDDNSRYLFEFVNECCPEIEAYWLCNSPEVVKEVRSLGFRAEVSDSAPGIAIQKRAGFAFYTNGIDDFSYRPHMLGANIVALWHGALGQKTSWHMNDHSKGIVHLLKEFKSFLFEWVYRDFTCAVSSYEAEFRRQAFRVSHGGIAVTGQPRNDVLIQVRNRANSGDGYILYMPTHGVGREQHIERTVRLLSCPSLTSALSARGVKVVVKLHYLTKISPDSCGKSVELIQGDTTMSTQDLLAGASLLITDYSSCIIDYCILKRPALLYLPDYDEYVRNQDIGKDWRELYREMGLVSESDLVERIKGFLDSGSADMSVTEWINQRYYPENEFSGVREYPFSFAVINALKERFPEIGGLNISKKQHTI